MVTIRFSGRCPSPAQSRIGMETDSRAEKIRFLLPQIADGQSAFLCLIMPDGTADEIRIRDGMVTLPARATEIPGRTRAWVEILGGDTVAWNSELFYLDVGDLPPISERTEQQYPTAIQDALAACVRAEGLSDASAQTAALVLAAGMVGIRYENGELQIDQARVDDADAYETAVGNGYTGTREEWEDALEVVTGNTQSAAQTRQQASEAAENAQEALETANAASQTAAAAQTAAQGAVRDLAAAHGTASLIVPSSAWSGEEAPFTAQVACEIAAADNTLIVGMGGAVTAQQIQTAIRARILCTGQAAGQITLTAYGIKPETDLAINVLGVNG